MNIEAMKQWLEALLDSIDDVRDCLNQNLPHAGYRRYDLRIEAYREQIAKHEKAITDLTAAIKAAEKQQQPVAWVERWYGSGPDRGWWVWEAGLTHGNAIAYIGESDSAEKLASLIVKKHNAAIHTPPAAQPAPDLLNALKRIVDEPNNTMSDGKALKEIIRIARDAITKATGEKL